MVECEKCLHQNVCDQASRQRWALMAGETKCSDFASKTPGKWEKIEDFDGEYHWRCSACGVEWFFYEGDPWENGCNYCPKCGAKMDGEGC